ncbi:HAD family hydrolase [Salininema proteolyticum]|uniref:HAD family hydrolase n=1 Tax=Salininema proteolyticum TaxID=1607685 RepID=A0ABV8TV27_9ACTN
MTPEATLILDFDGTVCLGHDPVRDYARRVTSLLDRTAADQFRKVFNAFLDGRPMTASTFDAYDPYHVVTILARENGVGDAERRSIFADVREKLGRGEYAVRTPAKFDQLIFSLPKTVEVVLATQAPATGMDGALDHLGLDGLFDEVHYDAGKPEGIGAMIDKRLGDMEPSQILCVGDIPANDLAAAVERGCPTAYIDHFGRPWSKASVSARDLADLYRFIDKWALAATTV